MKGIVFAFLLVLAVSLASFCPLTGTNQQSEQATAPLPMKPTVTSNPLYPSGFTNTFMALGSPAPQPAIQQDTYMDPEELGTIFFADLWLLLHKTFGCSSVNIWINDDYLSLTSIEQARNYTSGNVNLPFSEGHDCDNFAFQLLGYWSQGNLSFAFGYARSQLHAFNFFVDYKLDVYIVEPMTNEFTLYSQIKELNRECYCPTEYCPIVKCLV